MLLYLQKIRKGIFCNIIIPFCFLSNGMGVSFMFPAYFITKNQIIMENDKKEESKKTPFSRMIMDDFMLLMFLGVTIYAIFYLLWGVMELSNLPAIPEEIKAALLK